MLLDLDQTKISLANTTNQLMSLQHKQFVENRVYDEDETLANTSNVPKVETPKPRMVCLHSMFNQSIDCIQCYSQTIIDALSNALECSVNIMDKYFDKVTYNLSDSEDDEDNDNRRYESSNRFDLFIRK